MHGKALRGLLCAGLLSAFMGCDSPKQEPASQAPQAEAFGKSKRLYQ